MMKKTSYKLLAGVSILLVGSLIITPLQATPSLVPTNPQQPTILPRTQDTSFNQKIMALMRLTGFRALSACVIIDDQVVWSEGYGFYDVSKEKHTTPETIYILASITKTIVGTALMQLYEQELFDLDDDVNQYLPFELRNPTYPDEPITIRMLLSHTSSLNRNEQMSYYWMNFSGDPPFSFFPEPYLREFLLPGGAYYDDTVWSTDYKPGEQAMYANVGFDLLSYLVELISGEPFLQYCDSHLFQPLEMYNTSFNLSRLPLEQVAVPYQRYAGRYYRIDELGFVFVNDTPPEMYWRPRFYPAGGLYSTATDLSHFLIMHMNDGMYKDTRILKKETVELMHQIQPGNALGYGLAWMQTVISPRLIASGHAGDLPGTDTWMLYNKTKDIGVIYLANGNPGYGFLPLRGFFLFHYLLYTLFTKQGPYRTTIPQPVIEPSTFFSRTPLLSFHPLLQ